MRVCTFGKFTIRATAILQGTRWTGVFRLHQYTPDFSTSLPFLDEECTDETFETRNAAIEAAFEHAKRLVNTQPSESEAAGDSTIYPSAKTLDTSMPAASSQEPKVLFGRLFAGTEIGIVVVNLEATVIQASEAFRRMIGRINEDLENVSLWMLTHPEDVPVGQKQFADMVEGKLPNSLIDKRYLCKDGSYIWTRTRSNLLHDHKGKATHIAALIEPIHPSKPRISGSVG